MEEAKVEVPEPKGPELPDVVEYLKEVAQLQREHGFALRGISMHLSQLAGKVDAVEEFLDRVITAEDSQGEPEEKDE